MSDMTQTTKKSKKIITLLLVGVRFTYAAII